MEIVPSHFANAGRSISKRPLSIAKYAILFQITGCFFDDILIKLTPQWWLWGISGCSPMSEIHLSLLHSSFIPSLIRCRWLHLALSQGYWLDHGMDGLSTSIPNFDLRTIIIQKGRSMDESSKFLIKFRFGMLIFTSVYTLVVIVFAILRTLADGNVFGPFAGNSIGGTITVLVMVFNSILLIISIAAVIKSRMWWAHPSKSPTHRIVLCTNLRSSS